MVRMVEEVKKMIILQEVQEVWCPWCGTPQEAETLCCECGGPLLCPEGPDW